MLGLRHANRYSGSGVPPSRLAPRLGEHGEEILAEPRTDSSNRTKISPLAKS